MDGKQGGRVGDGEMGERVAVPERLLDVSPFLNNDMNISLEWP